MNSNLKKIFLAFFLSFSALATSQLWGSGDTANGRSPELEFGDWNSSGAPPPIYEPKYQYSYRCQAQLTDGLKYTDQLEGGSKNYDLIAVAETRLNNQSPFAEASNLHWYLKKVYSIDKVVDSQQTMPFPTLASWFGLTLTGGESQNEDLVTLNVQVGQTASDLTFVNSAERMGTRSEKVLTSLAQIDIRSKAENQIPRMSLRVICHKEK